MTVLDKNLVKCTLINMHNVIIIRLLIVHFAYYLCNYCTCKK